MPRLRKWTDEEMVGAVRRSISIRQVLLALGLSPTGANYETVHDAVSRLRLDTSHWTGQGHLRGGTHPWAPAIPLAQILVRHSSYHNLHQLKRRLLRAGLLEARCATCGLSAWRGERLPLVLDHVNGVNDDHRVENLRLLCPNCNSQQVTFAGRNKGRRHRGELADD